MIVAESNSSNNNSNNARKEQHRAPRVRSSQVLVIKHLPHNRPDRSKIVRLRAGSSRDQDLRGHSNRKEVPGHQSRRAEIQGRKVVVIREELPLIREVVQVRELVADREVVLQKGPNPDPIPAHKHASLNF
jgi:hypothetical protein